MAKFCPNCGKEISENAKFCDKCGSKINENFNQNNIQKGIPCNYCGNIIPFGQTQCFRCGNYIDPEANEEHTTAIILGYVFTFLMPIIGIIFGIYILTRKNKKIEKHGTIIIILSILLSLSVIATFIVLVI